MNDIWWIFSQSGNELPPCSPPAEKFGQYTSLRVSGESFPTIRWILRKDANNRSHASASIDRTYMKDRLLVSHAGRCWFLLMSLESQNLFRSITWLLSIFFGVNVNRHRFDGSIWSMRRFCWLPLS